MSKDSNEWCAPAIKNLSKPLILILVFIEGDCTLKDLVLETALKKKTSLKMDTNFTLSK